MDLFKKGWNKWLKLAHKIGNFQAQVIFTIFYFTILFPVGISIRFFSDPLNTKNRSRHSNFTSWKHTEENLQMAQRPY